MPGRQRGRGLRRYRPKQRGRGLRRYRPKRLGKQRGRGAGLGIALASLLPMLLGR